MRGEVLGRDAGERGRARAVTDLRAEASERARGAEGDAGRERAAASCTVGGSIPAAARFLRLSLRPSLYDSVSLPPLSIPPSQPLPTPPGTQQTNRTPPNMGPAAFSRTGGDTPALLPASALHAPPGLPPR